MQERGGQEAPGMRERARTGLNHRTNRKTRSERVVLKRVSQVILRRLDIASECWALKRAVCQSGD
jgi:hypothetical protein